MERYKNTSKVQLTFHGVTFQPGETKSVKGYINHKRMVRVTDEASSNTANKVESKKKTIGLSNNVSNSGNAVSPTTTNTQTHNTTDDDKAAAQKNDTTTNTNTTTTKVTVKEETADG